MRLHHQSHTCCACTKPITGGSLTLQLSLSHIPSKERTVDLVSDLQTGNTADKGQDGEDEGTLERSMTISQTSPVVQL